VTARPDTVALDSGRVVRVVEEVTSSAPLSLRFWDWALDRPVRDGLVVRAQPASGGPITTARPSSSGVYGFVSLPTTGDAERGPVDHFPAVPDDYVVGVEDPRGRYVAMCLLLSAPVGGIQPAPGTLPPVDGQVPTLPGFAVFSAPSRPMPSGCLALRADLRDADRPVTGNPGVFQPAGHALVSVEVGAETWWGVADHTGRLLVVIPAPTMGPPAVGAGPRDLSEQSWPVEVRVHYERLADPVGGSAAFAFPGVPDFAGIADQAEATARFAGQAFTASTTVTLAFGVDQVIRTPQRSDLLVKAPAQP
jgi:hypothetical protein